MHSDLLGTPLALNTSKIAAPSFDIGKITGAIQNKVDALGGDDAAEPPMKKLEPPMKKLASHTTRGNKSPAKAKGSKGQMVSKTSSAATNGSKGPIKKSSSVKKGSKGPMISNQAATTLVEKELGCHKNADPRHVKHITVYTDMKRNMWRIKRGPGRRDEIKRRFGDKPRETWKTIVQTVIELLTGKRE